ncbi:extracellular solute-binding protein [Paenibacillus humicola]|uniref:extracellular solute-binding protein n=1 Tax=Paenibacillus humicola TaxID=3110540 RepID=UPI00237BB2DA|nr:extracellular solute-binding protein [Paenibacillus humicola]
MSLWTAVRLFCLWLVFASALAGCADAGGDIGGADAAVDGTDKSIRLTLTDSWTTTSTTAVDIVHRQLIERFQQDNPDIDLSEDILDNASLKTKIKTLAAGNVLPDVFMMLGSDAKMFLDNKRIMPVNGLLAADPAWMRGFRPDSFDDFRIGDAITGIPMQMTATSIVYYNADIFRKAGYDSFPSTWDGFVDAVRKIKALGITPIAMGNKDQWVAGSCLLSTLGDRFAGTDWFGSIVAHGGAKFTDKPFVDALAAIKELADLGAFNGDINKLDNIQQRTLYYVGSAAMFLEGGWAVSSVAADAPKPILDQTRLALLPAVKGGRGAADAVSGGSGWAIALNANLSGEKLAAAVKFVKLLTGTEAANMAAERGDISGSYASDYDKSVSPALFDPYLTLLNGAEMTPVYDARLSPEVVQTMDRGLQELLTPGSKLSPLRLAQQIQESYSVSD